jgi:hypothetical protein
MLAKSKIKDIDMHKDYYNEEARENHARYVCEWHEYLAMSGKHQWGYPVNFARVRHPN